MTLLAETRLSLVAGAPHRALRYLTPTAFVIDVAAVSLAGAAATLGRDRLAIFDPSIVQVSDTLGYAGPLMMLGWLLMLWLVGAYSSDVFGAGTDEYKRVLNASVLAAGLVGVGSYLAQFELSPRLLRSALRDRRPDPARRPLRAPPGAHARPPPRRPPAPRPHRRRRPPRRRRRAGCSSARPGSATRSSAPSSPTARITGRDRRRRPRPRHARPSACRSSTWPTPTSSSSPAARSTRPPQMRRLAWELEQRRRRGRRRAARHRRLQRAGPDPPGRRPAADPHRQAALRRGASRAGKRTFDVVGVLALLVLFSPLLAFAALRIKLHDRGPVLFRQTRVGRDGERSAASSSARWCVDAEAAAGRSCTPRPATDDGLFKMKDDPRITRPGTWLRRFSIDELPQLFNVLLGDMSLVGPRPPLADRGGALRQATWSAGCGSAPA